MAKGYAGIGVEMEKCASMEAINRPRKEKNWSQTGRLIGKNIVDTGIDKPIEEESKKKKKRNMNKKFLEKCIMGRNLFMNGWL